MDLPRKVFGTSGPIIGPHKGELGDYYEILIDGAHVGEAGNRTGTRDGTRDVPRDFEVDLSRGTDKLVVQVRDWRAAGGMVGPVYLATDLNERIF